MTENNNDKIIIESLDGSEPRPSSSSSLPSVTSADQCDDSPIPCAEVSSDFEAVYRRRCADMLSRSQPAIVSLKSAVPWILGEKPFTFTVPPNEPDNPAAPGSRLRQRLKMLENAEDGETVEFTAYPYVQELLAVVAGTGDLPAGYDAWLALFTAVYLALPKEVTDRICEDLIWGLGGDRDAFMEIFRINKDDNRSDLNYFNITFKRKPTRIDIPNRQYFTVAHAALREYLHRRVLNVAESSYARKFSFYDLSVRFEEQIGNSTQFNREKNIEERLTLTSYFSTNNPRMLHHIITSPKLNVKINTWSQFWLRSEAEAVAFGDIFCSYINSKSGWKYYIVTGTLDTLVEKLAPIADYFEFANIVLSNLVASGVEFEFDATTLLTAAAKHGEESYLAWSRFVKRAEVFTKIPIVYLEERNWNMVMLQSALLKRDMLHHVEDSQLQEFMIPYLENLTVRSEDSYIGDIIINAFIKGKITDILRLHRLGLNLEFLRKHFESIDNAFIDNSFIQTLEFAERSGWFESGGVEYRNSFIHRLLMRQGAFDAVKWLYAKYPSTSSTIWRAFTEFTCYVKFNEKIMWDDTTSARRKRRNYIRGLQWILLENRSVWENCVDEKIVVDSIRRIDYHRLHLLYALGCVKPSKEHLQAAIKLPIMNNMTGGRVTHALYLTLRCIRNALLANGVKIHLHDFMLTVGNNIHTVALVWMMRRGFFVATKPKKKRIPKPTSPQ